MHPNLRREIRIAFLRDSFKKASLLTLSYDAPGIRGYRGHTERRGRLCRFAARIGRIFWVFKHPKNENRAAKAEAELAQIQKKKADLETKLDENQKEIASLQTPVQEAKKNPNASPADNSATAPAADLQSQVDELRRQLDSAEKEKAFLSEKLQDIQDRADQPKEGKKRREAVRETAPRRTGLRGAILAVNQAYNFVVLNLGTRHGVESNAEMLVLRDGALVGKIRISSVEPATAIGDIITGSLARGAQIQPGDNVIYAGTNP